MSQTSDHTVVKAIFTDSYGLQVIDNDMKYYTLVTMTRNPYTADFDTIESSHFRDLVLTLRAFELKLDLLISAGEAIEKR